MKVSLGNISKFPRQPVATFFYVAIECFHMTSAEGGGGN